MDISVSGSSGVDVLLLHGIQGTRLAWSEIECDLNQDYRCVMPNFDGRGRRRDGYCAPALNLKGFASELNSVLQKTASPGFILVGWSLGVSVILEYLTRYDQTPVGGIVLISGSPALNTCSWFKQTDPVLLEAEIAEREQRLKLSETAHPGAVAALWSAIKSSNHESSLSHIRPPCLVIHGEQDEDCPFDHGLRLQKQIPDSTLLPIADGGHSVLRTHPVLIATAVREFIQELKSHGDNVCN
ncbi:alpha/beta hydrolase [Paenalcaligenes niemegkensis]|uniref:alpha/beta fold hydrolase n=1 Tax=Paenalcaligenes niemegkensis TaxID=2895469 RepID=UPI001EE9158F|nr:alpha/beta hydrolase [Paenalcaligenes niemegkensis]MCQ9618191.1 alpha/beta hydrolase [Paenalcaligenes niemegkensis]